MRALAGVVLFGLATWLFRDIRGPRWWVAPQTVMVVRAWGENAQDLFRRRDSRLWIDHGTGTATIVREGLKHRRRMHESEAIHLLNAWLATADPPPLSERELPT